MTFDEYNTKQDALCTELKLEWTDEKYRKLIDLQYEYMNDVLTEYEKTVGDDPAKGVCYQLLHYAVHDSQSGNAIVDADFVTNEAEAEALQDTIFAEIGQYLLDDCQVYKDGDGCYVADVMFGGAYVPEWDGWIEYLKGSGD